MFCKRMSMWLQYNLMNVRIHKTVVYERDVKTHRGILTFCHDVSRCVANMGFVSLYRRGL